MARYRGRMNPDYHSEINVSKKVVGMLFEISNLKKKNGFVNDLVDPHMKQVLAKRRVDSQERSLVTPLFLCFIYELDDLKSLLA